jgi:TolB-like protein
MLRPHAYSALAALLAAGPVAAGQRTVAITYFDNNSGSAELAPLSRGLTDMLITDLSNVGALQIVEREKLNLVLSELKLQQSKFVDPKTAVKLGKGLAAEFIMCGGLTMTHDDLRIDTRVLDVKTGKVAVTEKVEGKKDEFFSLEKDLVDVVIRALDVKLATSEKSKLRSNPTESFEAWSKYSAGLVAQDEGNEAKARELFQAALDLDPNYRAAKTATERLKVIFQRDDAAKAKSTSAERAALDPKAKDFAAKVDALLQHLDDTDADQLAKKLELLTWLAERDLTPSSPGLSRVPLDGLGLAFRHLDNPSQRENLPKACEYFITRYPKEDYPRTYCKTMLRVLERQIDLDAQAQRWSSDQAQAMTYGPGDWRYALAKNEPALARLIALYASKVKR